MPHLGAESRLLRTGEGRLGIRGNDGAGQRLAVALQNPDLERSRERGRRIRQRGGEAERASGEGAGGVKV